MQRKTLYSMVAAFGLMVTGPLIADPYGPPPANYGGITIISISEPAFPNILANKLGLTETQRAQIHDIVDNTRTQVYKLSAEMQQNQSAIADMVNNDYSKRKLGKMTSKQGKLYGEKIQLEIQAKYNVMAVLTPYQKQKVQAFQQLRQS